MNRREFLEGLGATAAVPALGGRRARPAHAMAATRRDRRTEDAAPPPDATRQLARYVVGSRPDDVPAAVYREARRTLANWVGCALGGSHHETLDIAMAALAPLAGPAQATVLGRRERVDALTASLMNGMSSHVLDFDDTHLKTVIHPAGTVAPAILALAERQPVTGRDFLHALVLGADVELRIGNAVYPAHYDRGWHITCTAGVFGSAAACGRLLGLSEQQMIWALGLAATQPVGLREMFGSMTKSFHPGRAAQNGLTSALLAAKGFTSAEAGLEGKSGWLHVVSTEVKYDEITGGLGERFELMLNSYKPFACGVVMHPTIDACLQLRAAEHLSADQIERIDLQVHPLVLELTGKRTPQTGLEAKFSIYAAAAIAIVTGAAGPKQFTDEWARNPQVVALRDRVTATVTPGIGEAQVRATITLNDGRRLEKYIEHAVGSLEHPMTDADLEAKFLDLADGVLPAARARRLLDLCWQIETLPDAADLARAGT
jgi:2-methylcitrate dehydratase PrpD